MRAKKRFGQHFLKNFDIAKRIVDSLDFTLPDRKINVLEIGGGTGVLTQFLVTKEQYQLYVVEIDRDALAILRQKFPQLKGRIIAGDFLRLNLEQYFVPPLLVIGNVPYNITGPIIFKILDYRQMIYQSVLMVQKEVAQRIVAKPGTKDYGILSVMVQSFYDAKYLFSVPPGAFSPPPKVTSAVVKLDKKQKQPPIDDYDFFKYVVKTAFNQRRKTLRNALKKLYNIDRVPPEILDKRAEQLTIEQFWQLTNLVK